MIRTVQKNALNRTLSFELKLEIIQISLIKGKIIYRNHHNKIDKYWRQRKLSLCKKPIQNHFWSHENLIFSCANTLVFNLMRLKSQKAISMHTSPQFYPLYIEKIARQALSTPIIYLLMMTKLHYPMIISTMHRKRTDAYSEPCPTSKMEYFAKKKTLHLRCLIGFWIQLWRVFASDELCLPTSP